MQLRTDALAALKAQIADGLWESVSANEHAETVPGDPPTVKRHITISIVEPKTGRMLAFVLEGGVGMPSHGVLHFNGSAFDFTDAPLIALLMDALSSDAQDVYGDELMAFLVPLEPG